MAAVVRVKRRRHEDPADSLLLSCKRLKSSEEPNTTRDEDLEAIQSVFRFAGTVTETVGFLLIFSDCKNFSKQADHQNSPIHNCHPLVILHQLFNRLHQ